MKKLLIILGILPLLFFFAIANADTGYVDPNGDSTPLQWSVDPAGTHYTAVDDGIRQPTAGGTADKVYTVSAAYVDVYDMTSLTDVGTVTNVTVWGYGQTGNPPNTDVNVNILMAGSWTTATAFVFTNTWSWKSVSFNGTWTQANLDALQVKITSVLGGGIYNHEVASLYCVVTYTASGGGVTGKVIIISE